MKTPGYSVIDIKISELASSGLAYLTAIIEVKGLRFAGAVTVLTKMQISEDVFAEALGRAIKVALAESEKSDLQQYGWRGGNRGGGAGGFGGGKRQLDPAAQVEKGRMNGIFAKALKESGWQRGEITGAIALITGLPYAKDCEYGLTNQQASDLEGKIQRGEKPAPDQVPQQAKFPEKNRLQQAATAAGMDADRLNAWLSKSHPGCHLGRITSALALAAAEKLEQTVAQKAGQA